MKQKKNIRNVIITGAFLVLVLLSSVSAYERLCLTYGQSVPDDIIARYTCWSDLCQICVTDTLYPTHPGKCDVIDGCTALGENGTTVDGEPPNIQVFSPVEGHVYNSRRVLFDIESNEPASMSWIDTVYGRGRWRRLSSNTDKYSRSISFKDGFNNITIKAIDRNNNPVLVTRSFFVDSKKPRITRTEPRRGFASGDFEIQFTEENPELLVLYYGNVLGGFNQTEVDLDTCTYARKRYYCSTNVSLETYHGQQIEYWFELTDIAQVVAVSKSYHLYVDTVDPVILNPDSFYTQDERYVFFNITITEDNFDEVTYYDYNDRRPRWRRLCSRLKDDTCVKKKSFTRGQHILDVQVVDDAGNAIAERITFLTEY